MNCRILTGLTLIILAVGYACGEQERTDPIRTRLDIATQADQALKQLL
jgi:hypothetical protein